MGEQEAQLRKIEIKSATSNPCSAFAREIKPTTCNLCYQNRVEIRETYRQGEGAVQMDQGD
jgi:hypothetical protein